MEEIIREPPVTTVVRVPIMVLPHQTMVIVASQDMTEEERLKATTARKRCEEICDLHVWIPQRLVSVPLNEETIQEINSVI